MPVSVAAVMKVRHLRDKRKAEHGVSHAADRASYWRSLSMPASRQTYLDEVLEKRVISAGIMWQPRQLVLCESYLSIYEVGRSSRELDRVPLHEILSVGTVQEDTREGMLYEASEQSPDVQLKITVDDFLGLQNGKSSFHIQRTRTFKVATVEGGYNGGQVIHFRAANETGCERWVSVIKSCSVKALEHHLEAMKRSTFESMRFSLSVVYHSNWFQLLVAILIISNFVISCVQAELREPCGTPADKFLNSVDLIFTTVFIAEITGNLIVNWFKPFFLKPGEGEAIVLRVVQCLSFATVAR
jgi:hypothetical protein